MQLIYFLVSFLFILSLIFILKRYQSQSLQPGIVIILNGPSAAGKSSIQKEFQKLMMPHLWVKLGIDGLFDAPMPDITSEDLEFWQHENSIRFVTTTQDVDENSVITLHVGKEGQKVVRGMNKAIAAYAKSGCNVIVDYIGYQQEWLEDLQQQLQGIKTYWVKVAIPLEVLEAREAARGTSPKGHARSHFDTVYGMIKYDLVVHTDTDSAAQAAKQIKESLNL